MTLQSTRLPIIIHHKPKGVSRAELLKRESEPGSQTVDDGKPDCLLSLVALHGGGCRTPVCANVRSSFRPGLIE
jgi:hypothetical protein